MPWTRIFIHLVFSTKNREPFLDSEWLRKTVFQHIKKNGDEKGIYIDCVSGWEDHAHCMICLGKEQTVSKIVQQIKGESSFWINKNELTYSKFAWQDDYWAVSVCENRIKIIRKYIHNQEIHHASQSFSSEINMFIKDNCLKNPLPAT
jgi:putative transposase